MKVKFQQLKEKLEPEPELITEEIGEETTGEPEPEIPGEAKTTTPPEETSGTEEVMGDDSDAEGMYED